VRAADPHMKSEENDRPVGITEIAAMLNVQRPTVDRWRTRGLLPAPDWIVGGRPAWATTN
jgi:predicted DNA-binding transcriptional regulator AlpA